jgi:zinc protease
MLSSMRQILPALLLSLCIVPLARPAAWPHEASDLPPDPGVTFGQLENGLRYAILQNREPRLRASLRLVARAGSLNERDDQRGLAHFLEHMAFNGTENYPAGTLIEYFQRLGMAFGPDTNAYTGFDRTVYVIELPEASPESVDEGLRVLRDFAHKMEIDPAEVEDERGVILSEMRDRDSVEFRTIVAEYQFLLPDTLVPRRFPIGVPETVQAATAELLRDFYADWYRPDNLAVVAVGDLEPAVAEAAIHRVFSAIPPTEEAPAQPPATGRVPMLQDHRARLHSEPEAGNVRVSIQTVTPFTRRPDTAANRAREMPRQVAHAILSRRIAQLAREEDSPFNRGFASVGDSFDLFTNASIELFCEPQDWEAALATAERELRRALQHGFRQAEVAEIVASLLNAYEEAARAAPTRRSASLAEGIASSVIERMVFTHPETNLELMRPALQALTPEDCLAALRRTWRAPGRFLFVTGNLQLPDAERRILEVHAASAAQPVAALEELAVAEFAYTGFGPAGKVSEREHVEDLDVHLITLSNGVRLNLKRTDFQANAVSLTARLGGGLLELPENRPELAAVASSVFTSGALGQHDAIELRRLMAGRSVSVAFSVGEDAFILTGSASPRDLQLQMQLMTAYLTDPGLRPDAFRLARRNLEQAYRRLQSLPQGPLQLEVPRLLADGDERFGMPRLEAVLLVQPEEVRAWLRPALANGALEIAMVGDFEIEEAIAFAEATFGALPARGEKPDFQSARRLRYPEEPPVRTYQVPTEIPQGIVAVYWPTADRRDIRRTRRLSILADVFTDRMRLEIREKLGGAYSPYAASSPSDTFEGYGLFFALATVDPEMAAPIQQASLDIADALRTEGITDDELERALRPRIAAIRDARRTNGYWLNSVLAGAQERPEQLNWAREMEADFAAITREEINQLAQQFLRNERAARFISVPAPGSPGAEAAATQKPASP